MRDPLIGLAAHVGVRGPGSRWAKGRAGAANRHESGRASREFGRPKSQGNGRGRLPGDIL